MALLPVNANIAALIVVVHVLDCRVSEPADNLDAIPGLVPPVERLDLTVLIDSTTGVFGLPVSRPDIRVVPPPITAGYHTAFAGQWGYSVLAAASAGGRQTKTLMDFGYTPAALLNNMMLLEIAHDTIDAMVLSHGHYDHFGGLDRFLGQGPCDRGGLPSRCAPDP